MLTNDEIYVSVAKKRYIDHAQARSAASLLGTSPSVSTGHWIKPAFAARLEYRSQRLNPCVAHLALHSAVDAYLPRNMTARINVSQIQRQDRLYDAIKVVTSACVYRMSQKPRIDHPRKQRHSQVDIEPKLEHISKNQQDLKCAGDNIDVDQSALIADATLTDREDAVRFAFFEGSSRAKIERRISAPLRTV